ncbi:PLDc N-terminal domain-containing protein [Maribacter aestuarii]|uniref:PLDc N-terminal domain-containing protein n=1 Tax=Maribacter aestuarii TaxID=1130723 RepID=UPI00248CF895|nr:PLDc N-terminal domain-containing protein [Maribacter aestuarii]
MIGIWQIFLLLFALSSFLLPLIALINIVKSEFKGSNDKLIWVLVVLLLPILGSLVYFVVGSSQKVDKTENMDFYTK